MTHQQLKLFQFSSIFLAKSCENLRKAKRGKEGLLINLLIKRGIKIMVRPPCCDKGGVKKGPWTPEEDIILVTYIQEHGPGNWRAVPTNTGMYNLHSSSLSLSR